MVIPKPPKSHAAMQAIPVHVPASPCGPHFSGWQCPLLGWDRGWQRGPQECGRTTALKQLTMGAGCSVGKPLAQFLVAQGLGWETAESESHEHSSWVPVDSHRKGLTLQGTSKGGRERMAHVPQGYLGPLWPLSHQKLHFWKVPQMCVSGKLAQGSFGAGRFAQDTAGLGWLGLSVGSNLRPKLSYLVSHTSPFDSPD